MASINQQIKQMIEKDLAIQKDLARNLINIRALAKYLIKRHALNASVDAVVSAIRRHLMEAEFDKDEGLIRNIFKDASISTRNNIALITLNRPAIRYFQEIINTTQKLKSVIATKEINLIINEDEIDAIKAIADKSLIRAVEGLSEISITINEIGLNQKGVLARIANEISLRGISMSNVVIAPPEFLILVKKEDLVKTHEALMELTK